jgi:hypothetical protein
MLRNCNCGPSKFDFRNSATLCSLLPIPLLSGTFSSAQEGFKNQQKNIFRTVCFSGNQKLALKEQLHKILPLIFSWTPTRFHGQKYAENCGNEALKLRTWSCRHQKKLRLRNCGVAVAEQHCLKSCGIAIAEVFPSSCGIAITDSKKVARARLSINVHRPIGPYVHMDMDIFHMDMWTYGHLDIWI